MSANGKKKHGEAGVSNGKNIPFRYHGGSYDKPAYSPLTKFANKHKASNHKATATYMNGLTGGVIAVKLGYHFAGEEDYI